MHKALFFLAMFYVLSIIWMYIYICQDKWPLLVQGLLSLTLIPTSLKALLVLQEENFKYRLDGNGSLRHYKAEDYVFQTLAVNSVSLLFGWILIVVPLKLWLAIQPMLIEKGVDNPEAVASMGALITISYLVTIYSGFDLAKRQSTSKLTLLPYVAFSYGANAIVISAFNDCYVFDGTYVKDFACALLTFSTGMLIVKAMLAGNDVYKEHKRKWGGKMF